MLRLAKPLSTSALVCGLLIALVPSLVRVQGADTVQIHDSTLSYARVSMVTAGQMVVSMDATGDLRGLLTLRLDVLPDGTVAGGDWAIVVTYVEDLNPDGTVVPDGGAPTGGDPEAEYIRVVDDGTLGGSVTGEFVGSGSDGAPALVNVQLELTTGSLTFDSVAAGTGNVDADLGLTDAQ